MNRTRQLALLLVATSLVSLVGCGSVPDPWAEEAGPPRVLVTFPPIASWTRAVGGDQVGVLCLCTNVGPHDYQFSPRDATKLAKADLFLANGLGLDDSFADRLNSNGGNAKLTYRKLADALPEANRIKNPLYVPGQKHVHDEAGGCCGGHGPHDPHAWLGLSQVIVMVEKLRDDLKKVDPARASDYDRRANEYINQLKELLASGKQKLKNLNAPLLTTHESMKYFADNFDLKIIGSIRGLDGQDAGTMKLTELVEKCRKYDRVLLAVEPQYPTNTVELLRKELPKTEIVVVELDPLETCAPNTVLDGEWYLTKMRENVSALVKQVR